jgi:mannan endo-1,4-beta-mannosidase
MRAFLFAVLSLVLTTAFLSDSFSQDVLRVMGRHIHDPCGEELVMRGVNEMFIWSRDDLTGDRTMPEIALTGANTVRIVWLTDARNANASPENLDRAIQNAIDNKMFPMPELHDATGRLDRVPALVDYWTRPDIVEVLKKHEQYLLLNIANEAGDHNVKADEFKRVYSDAIARIRATGLRCPLVIDASGWGQDISILHETGPWLIDQDPERNLIFSVHTWWVADDGSRDRIIGGLQRSVDMGLPLIVGEFAPMGVKCREWIDYKTILQECQRHGIGWLAWSWGQVRNGDCHLMDMTGGEARGRFEGLHGWGKEVAVTDPNSIMNTSVRTWYLENGRCR